MHIFAFKVSFFSQIICDVTTKRQEINLNMLLNDNIVLNKKIFGVLNYFELICINIHDCVKQQVRICYEYRVVYWAIMNDII